MRTVLLVVGLVAACLAAEIPMNVSEVSTPALVVPAAAPGLVGAAIGAANATNSNVQLRPEDLIRPEINYNPVPSTDKPASVDNLFPDIHLTPGEQLIDVAKVPAYNVSSNNTHDVAENVMESTTKPTFIMKISSTTGKPVAEGAHPEPHPEPEPTAEPEPSSKGSTAGHGSSTGGAKTTLKPTSLPKTSGAASLSPAIVVAALAVLFSRLC